MFLNALVWVGIPLALVVALGLAVWKAKRRTVRLTLLAPLTLAVLASYGGVFVAGATTSSLAMADAPRTGVAPYDNTYTTIAALDVLCEKWGDPAVHQDARLEAAVASRCNTPDYPRPGVEVQGQRPAPWERR